MSSWHIPKLAGPTPELVAAEAEPHAQAPEAPSGGQHMAGPTDQQIEAILQQLGGLLVDNYGAKVTEVLTNGVCLTLRQRMHLMFRQPDPQP